MKKINILSVLICAVAFFACREENEPILKNDCLKRVVVPNVIGEEMEFAYAMAIEPGMGTLASMEVYSSIAGASGTRIDPATYHTDNGGQDVGEVVAQDSRLEGNTCRTDFSVPRSAATLRYYYVIPPEARDREVTFSFKVTSDSGEVATYEMGPYKICRMDIARDIELTNANCFFSIKDLTAYTEDEVRSSEEIAASVDFMYTHSSIGSIGHSIYSPLTPSEYFYGGISVPWVLVNDTKFIPVYQYRDQQLMGGQWAEFIDDPDLSRLSFSDSVQFMVGLKEYSGAFVRTGDGQYHAYIYFNSYANGRAVISLKRYKMY